MSAALHHFADYLASQSWQLALGFALVAGLCRALRNASAHWRYLLWIALLLKCVLPAAILVPLPDWHPQERVPMASHEVASTRSTQPPAAAVQPFVSNSRQQESLSVWQRLDIRDCLLTVWGAGAIILLAVATAKALRIQRDLKRERTLPDMELECEFLDLMNALALRSRPKLCLIRGLSQPFVWGVFHGCIYLPQGFAGQGTARQRRLVMAHELAHVLRWDAFVNFLQVLVQALFWFHPLVWWLNGMLRHEREKCCDEMAIASLRVDSREYGSAIVDRLAAHFEPACPPSSLAISGRAKDLEDRIQSILRPNRVFHRRPTRLAVVSVLSLAACIVPVRFSTTTQALTGMAETAAQRAAIDLRPYFNAMLVESWLPGSGENSLSEL